MRFSDALDLCIYEGERITRRDWNGKDMYVYYTPGRKIPIYRWHGDKPTKEDEERGYVKIAGHFDMKNAQGIRIIGWLASQTDMASEEWEVYETQEEEEQRVKEAKELIDELDKEGGYFDDKKKQKNDSLLLNLMFDADRTLHEFHSFKEIMRVKGAEFYDLELYSSHLYFTIEYDCENEKAIMDCIKETEGVSIDK